MVDQRDKITQEGFLESYLLKAIEFGDLALIEKLFKDVKDPRVIEKALNLSNNLASEQNKGKEFKGKDFSKIRGFFVKKAEELLNDPKLREDAKNRESLQESLKNLGKTLERVKEGIKKEVEQKGKNNSGAQAERKRSKSQKEEVNFDELFISAVKEGKINQVAGFLKVGANVNARDKNGHSALVIALNSGNADMVNFLMENKADINLFGVKKESFEKIKDQIKLPENSDKIGDGIKNFEDLQDNFSKKESGSARSLPVQKGAVKEVKIIPSKINQNQEILDKQVEEQMRSEMAARQLQEIMELLESEYVLACKAAQILRSERMKTNFFSGKINHEQTVNVEAKETQTASENLGVTEERSKLAEETTTKLEPKYDVVEILNNVQNQEDLGRYLIQAIRQGNEFMVTALIARGVNLNQSFGGEMPMQVALNSGNVFLSQILISRGAVSIHDKTHDKTIEEIKKQEEIKEGVGVVKENKEPEALKMASHIHFDPAHDDAHLKLTHNSPSNSKNENLPGHDHSEDNHDSRPPNSVVHPSSAEVLTTHRKSFTVIL